MAAPVPPPPGSLPSPMPDPSAWPKPARSRHGRGGTDRFDRAVGRKRAPRPRGQGERVVLSAIPGLTDPSVLRKPFVFPAPPLEEVSRTKSFDYTDWQGQDRRTHSRPLGSGLMDITLRFLLFTFDNARDLPRFWSLLTADDTPNPLNASEELLEIQEAGTPFRLTVGQRAIWDRDEIVMPATLRQVTIANRMGEPADRYVDVAFREYDEVPPLVTVKRGGVKSGRVPIIYRVPDDLNDRFNTLYDLARSNYGSNAAWRQIVGWNPGLKLVSPKEDLRTIKSLHGKTVRLLVIGGSEGGRDIPTQGKKKTTPVVNVPGGRS